jgi:hypothetical protein
MEITILKKIVGDKKQTIQSAGNTIGGKKGHIDTG